MKIDERELTTLGTVPDSSHPPLPSPAQVAALRNFLHGRSYEAYGVTIRLPDDPPLILGSGLARSREVNTAFFGLITQGSQALCTELHAEQTGPAVTILWQLLLHAAKPWSDDPALPADLRAAVMNLTK